MRNYSHWILFTIVLFLSAVLLALVDRNIQKSLEENANAETVSINKDAARMVSNSVTTFGAIVAGMQAFVSSTDNMPTAEALKSFLKIQLKSVDFQDPVVVSYIDTNHTFIYSFNQDEMNPDKLVGQKVSTFRDDEYIARLNRFMNHDDIQMFEPINLMEGWVGIPVNFRVHRDGKTYGYIASLVMFKSIVNGLYSSDKIENYAFGFNINDIEFDREIVHDNSKSYNDKRDTEYYRGFELDPNNGASTNLSMYGQTIQVVTWPKASVQVLTRDRILILMLFLTFVAFSLLFTWQIGNQKRLTALVEQSNDNLKAHGKKIEDQNIQMQKLNTTKDRFFSIIAHDLRGPLASIKGLVDLIKYDIILDPTLNDLMHRLGHSTNSTLNLLDNLLRWAMSQTGDISYKPTPLNLHNLISETINLLYQSASDKHITIRVEIDTDTYCIGDINMLTSVFRNLISNAIKFTAEGGSITITSSSDAKHQIISFKDSGVGMSAEKLKTLFDLSSRNSNEGTNGEAGTGLGLILCKEFIEIQKGHISVNSTLGQGTEFKIRIPKHQQTSMVA